MAVGRDETDFVYKRQIRPTLTKAGIHSVFMGTLEHNDDIDKRIIKEIEKSHLVIADLTYARPSVYFEAGYAQRKVPVIYTVRKDHFRVRPDDDHGNLRVHFDLQMRNIIGWRDSRDEQFGRRLLKRINLVTRPLLRDREKEHQLEEERRQFQIRPLASRLRAVAAIFRGSLTRRGYKTIRLRDDYVPWVGRKPNRNTMNLCMLSVQPSFSIREIQSNVHNAVKVLQSRFDVPGKDDDQRYQWQNRWSGYLMPKRRETKDVKQMAVRIILCSFNTIPRGRVATALPSFQGDETGHHFASDILPMIWHAPDLPLATSVHIFDGIQSERDALNKSKSALT